MTILLLQLASAALLAVVGTTAATMILVTTFGLDRRHRNLDLLLSRAASVVVSLGRRRTRRVPVGRGRGRAARAAVAPSSTHTDGSDDVDEDEDDNGDAGGKSTPPPPPPAETLVLYDYEGCPFCRRVRFALADLGLDAVVVRPCPRPTFDATAADAVVKEGRSRFRPDVLKMGGKLQVPFLVDGNTGTNLYESGDIVEHLRRHYGERADGEGGRGGRSDGTSSLSILASFVASGLRSAPRMGLLRASSGGATPWPPRELLALHSRENDPSCRLVREALCVLEVPYVLRNVADDDDGKRKVPRLFDPNTGYQSEEGDGFGAVEYLYGRYLPPDDEEDDTKGTFSATWVWRQRFKALGRGLLGSSAGGNSSAATEGGGAKSKKLE